MKTQKAATDNQAIIQYWSTRAEGYALRTVDELNSARGDNWQNKLARLLPLPPQAPVLDVGCGPGLFTLLAARMGFQATGVDTCPAMLEEARRNARESHLEATFLEADAARLPFPDASFSAVISRYVVWNLPAPEAALAEWRRVLKPGGFIVYADGNHYRYLTDPDYARLAETTAVPYGHEARFVLNVDTSPMERIAQTLPLSAEDRPGTDVNLLLSLGLQEVIVTDVETAEIKDPVAPDSGGTRTLITNFMIRAQKTE